MTWFCFRYYIQINLRNQCIRLEIPYLGHSVGEKYYLTIGMLQKSMSRRLYQSGAIMSGWSTEFISLPGAE